MSKALNKILSSALAFCIMTPVLGAVVSHGEDLSPNVMLEDGFELAADGPISMRMGSKIPIGWSFDNSTGTGVAVFDAGVVSHEKASGESSLSIEAVPNNSAGFVTPFITVNSEELAYSVSFKWKRSDDFVNNTAGMGVMFYQGDTLISTKNKGLGTPPVDWAEKTVEIDPTWFPQKSFDSIKIRLYTAYNGKENAAAAGMMYYDDFRMSCSYDDEYILVDVLPDSEYGWYFIGDTVTYKPQKSLPASVTHIRATLYNSYDEVIDEFVITRDEFERSGWVYKPEETGFYQVEFTGVTNLGEGTITSSYVYHNVTYYINKRGFVVTKETKPIEERNPNSWFVCEAAITGSMESIEMSELVGFSGARLHAWPWETTKNNQKSGPSTNPAKGLYNWSVTDKVIEKMRELGYGVMCDIMYCPQWATTHPELTGTANTNDLFYYGSRPPKDMAYFDEYVRQVARRYGDVIDIYEIWNEVDRPGNSGFWIDTPVKTYAELLKTGYIAAKEEDPDCMVIMAGLYKRAYNFYEEILETTDVYNYYDALATHENTVDPETFQRHEVENGYEKKPWMNNEAHYSIIRAGNTGNMNQTARQQAIRMFQQGYFLDYKAGAIMTVHFRPNERCDAECMADAVKQGRDDMSYGLWRRRPFAEPTLRCNTLHTFLDIMGKEFSYVSEHLFNEDKIKAVRFSSDGEDLVAMWSGEDFSIPEEFKASFTEDTAFIDWEGRAFSPDEALRADTIYYFKVLDDAALDALPKSENGVLNFGTAATTVSYNAKEVGYGTGTQLFNEKNFKTIARDINWIDEDWTYVEKVDGGTQLDGFDAKFAVSVNEKGLYLMVEVEDATYFPQNGEERSDKLYNADGIQFAIDATNEGSQNARMEFHAGMNKGQATLFKQTAADIGGAHITGWTSGGAVLSSDYINITTEGTKTVYKIFIPIFEMYPYQYSEDNKELRMSILVNDHDTNVRRGLLRWSNGIDGGKTVGRFGKIILP